MDDRKFSQAYIDAQFQSITASLPHIDVETFVLERRVEKEFEVVVTNENDYLCMKRCLKRVGIGAAALAGISAAYLVANPPAKTVNHMQHFDLVYQAAIQDGFAPFATTLENADYEIQFKQSLGTCTLAVTTQLITSLRPVGSTHFSQQYIVAAAPGHDNPFITQNFQELSHEPALNNCTSTVTHK